MRTLLVIAMTLGVVGAALDTTPVDAARKRGRQVESEIIRGGEVGDDRYPFVATIGWWDTADPVCGGSLIAPSFVLTAAHCVEGESADQLRVAVGRTVLSSGIGEVRGVAAITLHPSYRSWAQSPPYDVAVVQLSAPVTTITPVTIVQAGDGSLEAAGTPLTLVGWGGLSLYGDQVSDRMQEVQLPVVGDGKCHHQWRRAGRQQGLPQGLMICTPKRRVGFGDSGGPLFTTVGTMTVQVGVANGTGPKERAPDYHAQLSAPDINDFIRSIIGL
jgi:secreted trypsin-like serine protease